MSIAQKWLDHSLEAMPWAEAPKAWNAEHFAKGISIIRKAINLNSDGLEALIGFIAQDDFWGSVALSPQALMGKSKNGLRKIDNLLKAMQPKADRDHRRFEKALVNTNFEEILF